MSLIEQAARRLEELRRSGIEVPGAVPQTPAPRETSIGVPGSPAAWVPEVKAEPERAGPGVVRGIASRTPTIGRRSRQVEIDLARLASQGYLTPDSPRARIADEFRIMKRPLVSNIQAAAQGTAASRNALIMVTSALPGEGKTFVSINLAISLASELDSTVMLVDADVARPSVLQRLGLPSAPGLLDLLTDSSLGMSDVLLRTNIEKLTLLPAGRPQSRATELLASDAMNRLLDELARRYPDRILVFDAPPLLPSTESRVLATQMGQVVFVVEAERTPQKTVEQAMATIASCPLVLPLLNKITRSEVGSYYGYYGAAEA